MPHSRLRIAASKRFGSSSINKTGIPSELIDLQKRVRAGENLESISPRKILSWFGFDRRSPWLTNYINAAFQEAGLVTDVDWSSVNIDAPITVALAPPSMLRNPEESSIPSPAELETANEAASTPRMDPTLRIRVLKSAVQYPLVVQPGDSISKAVTTMLAKDYSQLPVLQHRSVLGVFSWRSIGKRLALGAKPKTVSECLETPLELRADTPLIDAIGPIAANDYALIKDESGRLVGLVTASDLSVEFKSLSEPFLLLREIESYIRAILGAKLSEEEVRSLRDPSSKREVRNIADLTLGEYLFGLSQENVWKKLDLNVDRKSFVKALDDVRSVRNDVMHFDPDPIQEERLTLVREFVRLMQAVGESIK